MQNIIIVFLFFFIVKICISGSYESNSIHSFTITKSIELPDKSSYSTLEAKGARSYNLGIYEIFNCAGHRILFKDKLEAQDIYCNVELANGHRYTFFMNRSETDADAGVGYVMIAGGSKPFEKIKNTKCNYAVSFFKDHAYVKIKCKVNDSILNEVSK